MEDEKMKKITGIMLAAQAAAIIMTGCGGGAAQTAPLEEAAPATAEEAVTEEAAPEEAPETVSEEETATEAAADAVETEGAGAAYEDPKSLPVYAYQGTEEYMGVIDDFLVAEEKARVTDQAGVYIPFGFIAHVDDAKADDIIAYGSFNLDGYDLINTTLFDTTGWRTYGAIHLKKNEDGAFEVVSADLPETEEESEEVLSPVKGLFEKVAAEADSRLDQLQEEAIAEYVNANALNITQWQQHGHSPRAVLNAPDTPEEAQFYRFSSPLGYEMTYDLREFTLSSDDESDVYGAIDKDDVWTGTLMAVRKTEGEDTDAAIAAALSGTDAKGLTAADATIGSGISCKRAEYDEKLEDGRIFRYVCYAVPADKGVITVTLETTVEKGVSELTVEELEKQFESTLSTFKL